MTHEIDVQWNVNLPGFPDATYVKQAAAMTLEEMHSAPSEVCIRFVDVQEISALNEQYRSQAQPTNVLSFPNGEHDESGRMLLGDVVICSPVICDEASAQNKPVDAHLGHMIIHGILHLQGHDHSEDHQAEAMEAVEIVLMQKLGFGNPYEV